MFRVALPPSEDIARSEPTRAAPCFELDSAPLLAAGCSVVEATLEKIEARRGALELRILRRCDTFGPGYSYLWSVTDLARRSCAGAAFDPAVAVDRLLLAAARLDRNEVSTCSTD